MRIRQCFAVVCAAALMTGASVAAAEADRGAASADLEVLVKAKSKRFDALYLLPGADFRGYTKVMLDPTRVAFAKDWSRDINQTMDLLRRTTIEDAEQIAEQAGAGFGGIFANALKNAGYEVVAAPGADVLRLSPQVVNLHITAPENLTTSPRTRVYAADAGEATLVLQFYDSTTGALLGRAVDRRTAGDRGNFRDGVSFRLRYEISTVSNRSDFEALFATWAWMSVKAFEELKAQSPVALAPQAPEP
jgi:hypothetical protein